MHFTISQQDQVWTYVHNIYIPHPVKVEPTDINKLPSVYNGNPHELTDMIIWLFYGTYLSELFLDKVHI